MQVESGREGTERVLRFDSAAPLPKEPPPAPLPGEAFFDRGTAPLRALAGADFEVVREPTGMITRFDGLDALKERLTKGIDPADPLRGGIDRILSFGSLRYMLTPAIVVPAKRLQPGEEESFLDLRPLPDTVGLAGYLYYRGTYRIAEVKDGAARLEMKAEVTLDPPAGMPSWPAGTEKGRVRLRLAKGECRAWARIETASGRLLADEHATDLDLYFVRPDGKGEVPIPTKVVQGTKTVE